MMERIICLVARVFQVDPIVIRFLFAKDSPIFKQIAFTAPLSLIGVVSSFAMPLLFAKQVDYVTQSYLNHDQSLLFNFYYIVGSIFCYTMTMFVIDKIIGWQLNKLNFEHDNYIEDRINDHLSTLDSGKFNTSLKNVINEVRSSSAVLPSNVYDFGTSILSIPASIIGFAVVAKFLNPYMIILVITNSVITYLISWYKDRLSLQTTNINYERNGKIAQIRTLIWYNFGNLMNTGKLNSVINYYKSNRQILVDANIEVGQKSDKWNILDRSVSEIITTLNQILAGYLVYSGQMTIGGLSTYPSYNSKASSLIRTISSLVSKLYDLTISLKKLEFILILRSNVDLSGTLGIDNIDSVEYQDVEYAYEDVEGLYAEFQDRFKDLIAQNPLSLIFSKPAVSIESKPKLLDKVLKGFTLKVSKGEIVTLVGPNGCGKTTVLQMLQKSYDPQGGQILVNGNPIQGYNPDLIRLNVRSISQRQELLHGFSLREMINDSDEIVSDDNILKVAELLGLNLTVEDLDKVYGYNLNLSGGQQQLIMFVSVFINKFRITSKSSLIILDEGFNQIDPAKKATIFGLIPKYLDDCIVLIVTHEIDLAMKSDRVVVFGDGIVALEGSPQDLLLTDNLFSKYAGVIKN
jgi:ABC-type bacteriocin/lantibiotic exporter with double-glycine peptidase domain